jgi:AcrR family transcriptional regulator
MLDAMVPSASRSRRRKPTAVWRGENAAVRRRKPTAVRRSEIADAAMRLIAARGARGFTARSLAREVGITAGAVFRHFPSMDAVVGAVVERMESVLFAELPVEGGDPLTRLRHFFEQRVDAILEHPQLSRLLLSDQLAQLGAPGQAARIEEFKHRTRSYVLECLREADRCGDLRGVAGPEEGTVLVQGAVLVLAHAGGGAGAAARLRARSRKVWATLESAFRGSARVPAGPARARTGRGRTRAAGLASPRA